MSRMVLFGRDYEFDTDFDVKKISKGYCSNCDENLPEYVSVDELEDVIKRISLSDFLRWKQDLISSFKSGDLLHANILLDELEASIT